MVLAFSRNTRNNTDPWYFLEGCGINIYTTVWKLLKKYILLEADRASLMWFTRAIMADTEAPAIWYSVLYTAACQMSEGEQRWQWLWWPVYPSHLLVFQRLQVKSNSHVTASININIMKPINLIFSDIWAEQLALISFHLE